MKTFSQEPCVIVEGGTDVLIPPNKLLGNGKNFQRQRKK